MMDNYCYLLTFPGNNFSCHEMIFEISQNSKMFLCLDGKEEKVVSSAPSGSE